MNPYTVHQIYFSPTGTTRKTLETITAGLSTDKINRYDLTYTNTATQQSIPDGIALIGIPVYAGRVPIDFLKRFETISAHNIPTILIALYGNREFDDALIELRDVAIQKGFNIIAAGAFIGEHSYSTAQSPIAQNRPDKEDLKIAREFGQKVATKIVANDLSQPKIDGNRPYRDRINFGGISPETIAKSCTLCGKCSDVCPVGVIKVDDCVTTDKQNCIMCAACTRICAFGARHFNHPSIEEKRAMLMEHCSAAKQATIFI